MARDKLIPVDLDIFSADFMSTARSTELTFTLWKDTRCQQSCKKSNC